jgi:pyrrolidone-carboxylate peptidase
MSSPRRLLTGFTFTVGDEINPSWVAVRQVAEARPYQELRGGFIHVPHAPEQVPDGNGPSRSIDQIAQGVMLETQPPRIRSTP